MFWIGVIITVAATFIELFIEKRNLWRIILSTLVILGVIISSAQFVSDQRIQRQVEQRSKDTEQRLKDSERVTLDRTINDKNIDLLSIILKNHAPEEFILSFLSTKEPTSLAEQLYNLLISAGWQVKVGPPVGMLIGGEPRLVDIRITTEQPTAVEQALYEWLNNNGIKAKISPTQPFKEIFIT